MPLRAAAPRRRHRRPLYLDRPPARMVAGTEPGTRGERVKIVVTGGAGFIGANLCRELAERAETDSVVALDDLSTGSPANLAGSGAVLVEGSILDREVLQQVVDTADAVVHLAARPSVPRSL